MGKKLIGRRDFMRSTLAGVGGLFFLPPNDWKPEVKIVEAKGKERKFVYRTLGKTGLKLPVINMGVMNSDNPNLIRAALDSGMVLLDTAHGYMGGRNEETIGGVIKGRPRDSFMIGSKVGLPQDRTTGLYNEGATTREFLRKLDISLKRLGLDYVEILYHHGVSWRESVVHEPTLKALVKAKEDGEIRFIGISTHANEPEVIRAATDSKVYDVILTAYNFQQRHYLEVREAIAKAAQAGIGIVGMKAIRGGFRQTPTVKNAAAALKWVLQDPNVHTIVPGFTTFEEMNIDLAVMEDLTLTDAEKREIRKEASLPGLYCQGCRQCLNQCPEQLPIPDLMRAYMYSYGYRNLALAKDLIMSMNLPAVACEDCFECPVKCSIGFNVSMKIRDVVRLRDVPSEFIV
ncbi:MAG: aldo/keto reductase [Thermodesulfobacteriota bacterium]|nr:aldo/keto reductase [Thermodesulfobacteriota bacterium]